MQRELFQNPPNEYKPVPYWGWNDKIEEAEVIHQVQEMARGGWGGFFIHPRHGQITPYLSEEWMDRVRVAVQEAKRQGVKMWLYDEHPYPSGHGGGTVPILGEEYRNRVLFCKLDNRPLRWDGLVKAYCAVEKDGEISDLQVLDDPASYRGPANLFFYFFEFVAPLGDVSCRGFSYVDALNPKVVKAFIENTHEAYLKALGSEIGQTVPGFYSDIPILTWFYSAPKPSLPWTPALPRIFRERKGYDLLEHLPSLLFDLGDYMRIRHDYWDLVTDVFVESFAKQVYEWCEEHGCIFTGHWWGEETLHWQPCWSGAIMPNLEYMHIPGTDHIGRVLDDPLGIKQVDSVVCQLGQKRLQAETYAMTGHGLSFIDRKSVGDWEYALGVNFLVDYIPDYSSRGSRKRDEPPSMFYQQPYWPYNRMLSDYYARLSYALSQGKRVVDILVLESMSTIWSIYRPTGADPAAMRPMPDPFGGTNYRAVQYGEWFTELTEGLLHLNRDHHYGDEKLMAKYGKVDDGKLVIGEAGYKVVVLPPSITWRQRTLQLLEEFIAQGGTVLAMKPLPTRVDGRESEGKVLPEGIQVVEGVEGVRRALDEVLEPDVIIDAPDVMFQHRKDGQQDIYFLVNTGRDEGRKATVRLKGQGAFEEWDPHTGEVRPYPSRNREGYSQVELNLPPVGSSLLVRTPGQPHNHEEPELQELGTVAMGERWEFERVHPNALMMDYCQYRFEDGPWSERVPLFVAQDMIRAAGFDVPFTVRYTFRVAQVPQGPVYLVVENPEWFEIILNGQVLNEAEPDYYWDWSFKKLKVTDLVQNEDNYLDLSGTLRLDQEFVIGYEWYGESFRFPAPFEACYVIGNFAVERDGDGFVIVSEPELVRSGNLTQRGYPFYVGHFVLSQEVVVPEGWSKAFLELEGCKAVVADISVNGDGVGNLAWAPHRVDVSSALKSGTNRVEIKLVNSLHNLLGPFHNPVGEVMGPVHWHSWRIAEPAPYALGDQEGMWTDDYYFKPLGLEGARFVLYK